jgi:hypothetical protein
MPVPTPPPHVVLPAALTEEDEAVRLFLKELDGPTPICDVMNTHDDLEPCDRPAAFVCLVSCGCQFIWCRPCWEHEVTHPRTGLWCDECDMGVTLAWREL